MPPRAQLDKLPKFNRIEIKRYLADNNPSVDDFVAFLNKNLAELDISVSRAAAHRFMQRQEIAARRLRESREMTEALARELPDAAMQGKQGRVLVEMARTFVHDLLCRVDQEGDVLDTKSIQEIGKGLAELARAQRLDQDFETKIQEALAKQREADAKKLTEAVDAGRIDAQAAAEARKIMGFT